MVWPGEASRRGPGRHVPSVLGYLIGTTQTNPEDAEGTEILEGKKERLTTMKYGGKIIRIQHGTLIVETALGLRGVALDPELWAEIRADFELEDPTDLIGWAVDYDPAHGDLEITAPGDSGDDEQAGIDETRPPD